MAELITEEQPRIKFRAEREGLAADLHGCSATLEDLAGLMRELESAGVIPVLNDGLVGGNCAIAASLVGSSHDAPPANSCSAGAGAGAALLQPRRAAAGGKLMWVSRSGKDPGALMREKDFVLVTGFDPGSWSAQYRSATDEARPTSDTPLHAAALMGDVRAAYGWAEAPLVAVHGHALAEGPGLELAQCLGFPISHEATLFSTPEDLRELEQLFAAHAYPTHKCYVRRGHGFFLLGQSVQDVRESFRALILPHVGEAAPAAL